MTPSLLMRASFFFVIALLVGCVSAERERRKTPVEHLVEDFEVARASEHFEAADLEGRPLLVDTLLLDRWNLSSMYEQLEELYLRYRSAGLEFVTLIPDDAGRERRLDRTARLDFRHPVMMTSDLDALGSLQALGSLVLLSPGGRVVWSLDVAQDLGRLESAIVAQVR